MVNESNDVHKNEYIQEILHVLDIILASISGLSSASQRELINSLLRGFHNVKGNANLADLKLVADIAVKFEDIISAVRAEEIAVDNAFIDTLNHLVGKLRNIIIDPDRDDKESLSEKLLLRLDVILSGIGDDIPNDEDNEFDDANNHNNLENRKVRDDIAECVSVGGGGIVLEIDGNIAAVEPNRDNSCQMPKNTYRPLRILVVEDDFTSRQLLVSALSKYGECHIAKDGNEAVMAVKKSFDAKPLATYDLICMDVQMPVMDGTDAARKIREIERKEFAEGTSNESVIIMISCVEDPKIIMESCYKCGANHYFVKPLDLNQMNRQMRKLNLIGSC